MDESRQFEIIWLELKLIFHMQNLIKLNALKKKKKIYLYFSDHLWATQIITLQMPVFPYRNINFKII